MSESKLSLFNLFLAIAMLELISDCNGLGVWWYSGEDASLLFRGLGFDLSHLPEKLLASYRFDLGQY